MESLANILWFSRGEHDLEPTPCEQRARAPVQNNVHLVPRVHSRQGSSCAQRAKALLKVAYPERMVQTNIHNRQLPQQTTPLQVLTAAFVCRLSACKQKQQKTMLADLIGCVALHLVEQTDKKKMPGSGISRKARQCRVSFASLFKSSCQDTCPWSNNVPLPSNSMLILWFRCQTQTDRQHAPTRHASAVRKHNCINAWKQMHSGRGLFFLIFSFSFPCLCI